jgi:hypothetical protein
LSSTRRMVHHTYGKKRRRLPAYSNTSNPAKDTCHNSTPRCTFIQIIRTTRQADPAFLLMGLAQNTTHGCFAGRCDDRRQRGSDPQSSIGTISTAISWSTHPKTSSVTNSQSLLNVLVAAGERQRLGLVATDESDARRAQWRGD